MQKALETQVLIVGAGPVGLTLAMDLARRGISVMVAETRRRGEPPSVKCNHVAARTMEIFRQLGVAQVVRDAGLPLEHAHDVSYRTSFTGHELSRIHIPARQHRFTDHSGPDGNWPTPEPPHRINQIYLEPLLNAHAATQSGLVLLNRMQVQNFTQTESGVLARILDLDTGVSRHITCEYLVGCDGGRSGVRKALGATFSGTPVVGRVQSTYFRAPDLLARAPHEPAWATFSLNPRRSGNVYAIDGRETFLLHNYLRADEPDFDTVDRDHAIRTILGVGSDFHYEILSKEDWTGRRLVADRFRDRRAFICGDAAHIWVPMAGYGMNAGIADAMDLSWLLAARLQGWGAPGILDAYEAERQPITEQVSSFAMNHALALQKQREGVPAGIEDEGPEGEAVRRTTGQALYELNVRQYCCAGLNFGYFYDASPLIAYDDEAAPDYSMDHFTSSTVPGARTPHFWLNDGRSLYDVLGTGYALLRFDSRVDVKPLLIAAAAGGVPMELFDLPADRAPEAYRHPLLLSRPDRHVAWRGDRVPDDLVTLLERLRGATPKAVGDPLGSMSTMS